MRCVSGADFGWRDGLRICPDDYPDTLRPVVRVDAAAVHTAWPHLGSVDPFLRHARTVLDEARARQALADVQCLACHRFGHEGGASGPELTGVVSKYSPRDILESILEPSKVVSEPYQNWTVGLTDGDEVSGRLISETAERIVLETDWRTGAQARVPRDEIEAIRPARLSPMPEGLVNGLSREEILDLIAYLVAGAGN